MGRCLARILQQLTTLYYYIPMQSNQLNSSLDVGTGRDLHPLTTMCKWTTPGVVKEIKCRLFQFECFDVDFAMIKMFRNNSHLSRCCHRNYVFTGMHATVTYLRFRVIYSARSISVKLAVFASALSRLSYALKA